MDENKNFPLLGRLKFTDKDTFRGAIIIHQNSLIHSLADLKGKRFAFADPQSTLGTRVPQRLLADGGITLADLQYHSHLKNHHDVSLAVLMGKYDAGAVKEEVFLNYQSRGLKALQWSVEIPSHPFVATKNLTDTQVAELSKLLQEIHLQAGSKKILLGIKKKCVAIIPAFAEEYETLYQIINNANSPIDEHAH